METYRGIKFNHQQDTPTFEFDHRLSDLNSITYLFSQLGLTPVHPDGAYGNQSYRTSDSSFIVTKSGMIPQKVLVVENYCHVIQFDKNTTTFISQGKAPPSSECFLHHEIYAALPEITVILHGHSNLLNEYAAKLGICTTEHFHDYGTPELAQSALELARQNQTFFILKDHGFVALGRHLNSTARLVLDYYGQLINLLKNDFTTKAQ
jgi:ribulose-5-phosphate 4-epimerase/fuculose-1-phosphate aldolase